VAPARHLEVGRLESRPTGGHPLVADIDDVEQIIRRRPTATRFTPGSKISDSVQPTA
jgi:hypothetical protein